MLPGVEPIPGALPLVPAEPLVPALPPVIPELLPLVPLDPLEPVPELPPELDPPEELMPDEAPEAPAEPLGLELVEPVGEAEEPLLPGAPAPLASEAPEEPPLVLGPVPLAAPVAPPAPAASDGPCFFFMDFLCAFFLSRIVLSSALAPLEPALSVAPADPAGAVPDAVPVPDMAPAALGEELAGDAVEELAPPVACARTMEFAFCSFKTEPSCAAEIPAAESSEINNANDTFFIDASRLDTDCF